MKYCSQDYHLPGLYARLCVIDLGRAITAGGEVLAICRKSHTANDTNGWHVEI